MFIEPGEVYLSEKLLGSEMFNMGGGMMGAPNMEEEDPELAEAIRMSLQENIQQQAQQQAEEQFQQQQQGNQG